MDNKKGETVQIFGCDIPRWKDCSRCGTELACKWSGFAYSEPCDKCKSTEEWQKEQDKKEKLSDTIGEVYKNKEAKAVWTFKGRHIYTNHKGDIIKDEPARPLETGVVEKRKEYC